MDTRTTIVDFTCGDKIVALEAEKHHIEGKGDAYVISRAQELVLGLEGFSSYYQDWQVDGYPVRYAEIMLPSHRSVGLIVAGERIPVPVVGEPCE